METQAVPTARPAWMDAFFAIAVALGFGLSLVRTPTTWLWAVGFFVVGSIVYAILRLRWARTHPRLASAPQRTSDGLGYMAVFLIAFLLTGVTPPENLRVAYALVSGVLIGGLGFFLLRREETRKVRHAAEAAKKAESEPETAQDGEAS